MPYDALLISHEVTADCRTLHDLLMAIAGVGALHKWRYDSYPIPTLSVFLAHLEG